MFIKDDTITLRCAEPEDAELIYRWENDRGIWRVSGTHVPFTRFQIDQFLLSNNDLFSQKQLRLMIDLNETGESIGCIDIYDYDALNERAKVGILIDETHRCQGHAASTLSLCLEYLFHDLMLHQVYCVIDEKNIESQKLFEKQSFVLCGRRKDWIKTEDGFIDALEYQLIRATANTSATGSSTFRQYR
jgi:diamine N-acetyltransferase